MKLLVINVNNRYTSFGCLPSFACTLVVILPNYAEKSQTEFPLDMYFIYHIYLYVLSDLRRMLSYIFRKFIPHEILLLLLLLWLQLAWWWHCCCLVACCGNLYCYYYCWMLTERCCHSLRLLLQQHATNVMCHKRWSIVLHIPYI